MRRLVWEHNRQRQHSACGAMLTMQQPTARGIFNNEVVRLVRWSCRPRSKKMSDSLRMPGEIDFKIFASKHSWTDKEWSGHAFMAIVLYKRASAKEERYGFFPDSAGLSRIYGPGVLMQETHSLTRFSRIRSTAAKLIDESKRCAIISNVNKWNT